MEQQIAALESRTIELQRQATIDKVEIDRLRQKLAALEERVSREAQERSAAIERANAPRDLEEEKVPSPRTVEVIEVSDLEEPLEEEPLPTEAPAVAAASPDDTSGVPSAGVAVSPSSAPAGERAAAAPAAARSTAPPAPAAPGAERPSAPVSASAVPPVEDGPSGLAVATEPRVTPAAQALYDQGYSLYHQGRYVDAEETFQRFLAAYAATDLADNAQFWIGQCRLGRNELQSALAAFRQTVREHPRGNKAPDALLAAGQVLERLNDTEGARTTYLEVERQFPDTTASTEAARRRQRLDGA